jgi:hypothetical protein
LKYGPNIKSVRVGPTEGKQKAGKNLSVTRQAMDMLPESWFNVILTGDERRRYSGGGFMK